MLLRYLQSIPYIFSAAVTISGSIATNPPETQFSRAANFKLVANVVRSDLEPSIQNWELTSYHVSPCYDYAVLQSPTAYNNSGGRSFYMNGSLPLPAYTNILSDGGTPPLPYGMILPQQNDTDSMGRRAVRINCGSGTRGLGIARIAGSIAADPHLADFTPGLSWFYACNASLPYGSAVQLFSASLVYDEKTPKGCATVELLPQCAFVNGTNHPFGQMVDCYKNVSQAV